MSAFAVCHEIKLFISIAGVDENHLIKEIKTMSVIAIISLDRNLTHNLKLLSLKIYLLILHFFLNEVDANLQVCLHLEGSNLAPESNPAK